MPKASAYDPRAVQALLQFAPQSGDPLAFIATAIIESGLRPNAVGDSGRSHGLFQLNDRGRLASYRLTPQQAYDPGINARVSADEFSKFAAKGLRGAQLALAAQRPSDPSYAAKFQAALPQAQAILASGGGGGGGGQAPGPQLGASLRGTTGKLDTERLLMLLRNQRGRSLRGIMPAQGFRTELAKLVQGARSRSGIGAAQRSLGQGLAPIAAALTMGGGPDAHGSRALGNWQSDTAYDLMGKAGQSIASPIGGTITNISGQPGGDPGFAGYGVTVDDRYFFKHLGSLGKGVAKGARVTPGQALGTLDAKTAGGPHLHLGAREKNLLAEALRYYGLGR